MAKEKKEKPEEKIVNLFDKEYKESNLTDDQKLMVNHVVDLERKINSSEFNLSQLRFGKQAFLDALKISLDKNEEEETSK